MKNFLLTSNLNLLSFSLKPFPLVPSLSDHVKSLSHPDYKLFFEYRKATMRSPLSLLFSWLDKPRDLSHSSCIFPSRPSNIFVSLPLDALTFPYTAFPYLKMLLSCLPLQVSMSALSPLLFFHSTSKCQNSQSQSDPCCLNLIAGSFFSSEIFHFRSLFLSVYRSKDIFMLANQTDVAVIMWLLSFVRFEIQSSEQNSCVLIASWERSLENV